MWFEPMTLLSVFKIIPLILMGLTLVLMFDGLGEAAARSPTQIWNMD